MNERLKELRISLNLSQEEFGKKISLSKPTISALENATRGLTDRVVSNICQQFNIGEAWLRFGHGNMFVETDKTVISALVDEYELDPLDQEIVECYLNLDANQRKAIKKYLRSLVGVTLADDTADTGMRSSVRKLLDVEEAPQQKSRPRKERTAITDADEAEADAFAAMAREQFLFQKRQEQQALSAKESDVG